MDCPKCAAKIETALRDIPGLSEIQVSTASQILSLTISQSSSLAQVEKAVSELGYQIFPEGQEGHLKPSYRRALGLVVALNLGYGVLEMAGGFWANSQSLKADALDFLGDGLISWVGLLVIGWSLIWRARAAMLQGLFLGGLGLAVLTSTLYGSLLARQPDAESMGMLGVAALAVNLAAAFVLIPHRQGDSSVRAIWLFSRNDAIGNLAVVLAAGLVYWLHSPWPDLLVAAGISVLFLHSSWVILRDALADQ
ncbi:cation transporter [bacterium]|nr:cation transporter [bacterium]